MAVFEIADMIYRFVASEIHYPDDLMEWYEVSEMIDELRFGDKYLEGLMKTE